ncbi:peptide ABC transporter substrate-binding protein [Butyrivibrio sp. WCE2006]|uniref:peptide ABC transporter substrate-binding protein n=1 Tax=Butyrivibrio sp. WCE2006 TaxID=1410611 RepID=UPI0005D172AA|nr:peptide ABC transporter substrate-binding protein [Butyrivibrio sp. WCE2006]
MRNKLLSLVIVMTMTLSLLTACNKQATDSSGEAPAAEPKTNEASVSSGNAASSSWPSTLTNSVHNSAAPDWTEYNQLIFNIKNTTDYNEREVMMHRAEDILMSTGAVVPLYYYNDPYLQKSSITGIYSSIFGTKYFMYASGCPNNALRVSLSSDPTYLDPALNSSVDGACLVANTFAGLYTYNADGECIPALADEANPYEVSEDGLNYTFHLKNDLKWSDGSPLTASDFVYSWNRAVSSSLSADYAYMFSNFAGYDDGKVKAKAVDDTTLTFSLTSPCAYILDLMAFPIFFPVNQACVEAADPDGVNPGAWAESVGFVASGAFTLASWEPGVSMVYVKNPYFYDAENVTIDQLVFLLSSDEEVIYNAYKNGELDFADSVPTEEIAGFISSGNPEFIIAPSLGTYYFAFNVNSHMFDGKSSTQAAAMRRAIGLLIDRNYIVENIGQTGQVVATSFIPAGMLDGNGGVFKTSDDKYKFPDASSTGYFPAEKTENSVQQAKSLFEEAGFKFGSDGKLSPDTPLAFEFLTNDSQSHVLVAESIQRDLAEVGIEVTIVKQDWNTFQQNRKDGNYDVAREGWLADFNDPINMLEMFLTDSGNNDPQFGREPLDEEE